MATKQATTLPADVRLMNAVSTLLFALVAAASLVAGASTLTRLPAFGIKSLRVDGDVARNNAMTIRANVAPKLAGSYFTLDLAATKRAFEGVPWVRTAVVQRVWPNRIAVHLEEHRAVAQWGDDRLVNAQGEVFDANLGDVEDDALPTLVGPEGTSAAMLALQQRLAPLFAAAALRIDRLTLSGRGSWRVELDSGAAIELGRGSDDEVLARSDRFVRTLAQVIAQYQRPLAHADLRHRDGYAVRLRGIATIDAPTSRANKR